SFRWSPACGASSLDDAVVVDGGDGTPVSSLAGAAGAPGVGVVFECWRESSSVRAVDSDGPGCFSTTAAPLSRSCTLLETLETIELSSFGTWARGVVSFILPLLKTPIAPAVRSPAMRMPAAILRWAAVDQ